MIQIIDLKNKNTLQEQQHTHMCQRLCFACTAYIQSIVLIVAIKQKCGIAYINANKFADIIKDICLVDDLDKFEHIETNI